VCQSLQAFCLWRGWESMGRPRPSSQIQPRSVCGDAKTFFWESRGWPVSLAHCIPWYALPSLGCLSLSTHEPITPTLLFPLFLAPFAAWLVSCFAPLPATPPLLLHPPSSFAPAKKYNTHMRPSLPVPCQTSQPVQRMVPSLFPSNVAFQGGWTAT
jgi:hypothetical protein